MAEYIIQDTTLSAIADQIRELTGSTSALSPSNMTSNMKQINSQANNQSDIIQQIKNGLINMLSKSATIGIATVTTTMSANNISFSGLPSNPSMYFMIPTNTSTFNLSSTAYIINVQYDGSTIQSYYMKSSSGNNWIASTTDITPSYNNGTLKLQSAAAQFVNNSYTLVYVIQPTEYAKDTLISVNSGVLSANNRSISFSGVPGDVSAFSIVPVTTVARDSSANYVWNVIYANNAYKLTYTAYSSNSYKVTSTTTGVSKNYNNGTLTVTCNTPYFKKGIDYKLVAVVSG